ncbi:MAG: 30S ribosomal protein S18 [Acidobacteria bacterium]|nr:MAG: 30S ribosomal protein S18 [Acidobacteriota bacterium]PYS81831.1 MAG: 30S ribosomal protein S18 [Acidobacteriota bacterium]
MSRNYDNRERDFDSEDEGMPAGRPAERDRRGGGRGGRFRRRKVCRFCVDKVDIIDFKDVKLLQNFIPERGKILPRRISGVCTAHQRMLAEAIKRARNIALLPYTAD